MNRIHRVFVFGCVAFGSLGCGSFQERHRQLYDSVYRNQRHIHSPHRQCASQEDCVKDVERAEAVVQQECHGFVHASDCDLAKDLLEVARENANYQRQHSYRPGQKCLKTFSNFQEGQNCVLACRAEGNNCIARTDPMTPDRAACISRESDCENGCVASVRQGNTVEVPCE